MCETGCAVPSRCSVLGSSAPLKTCVGDGERRYGHGGDVAAEGVDAEDVAADEEVVRGLRGREKESGR